LKPPPFEYFAPTTLTEAVELLSRSDDARLLAGGQSLMAMLNMRYVVPDRLIDLNRIAELDFIREEAGEIVVGAMTRQRTLQRSATIGAKLPVIQKALRFVGHFQTRNRGTIGGSLCQLDPSAELPAVARAYEATLVADGPNGRRSIPFTEFPLMFMTPSLAPDEILTAVRFRPWPALVGSGFREFSRRHGDFAVAGAIALLGADAGNVIQRASLTLFGVAEAPVRAQDAEELLIGNRIGKKLIEDASHLCIAHATLEDPYGSADYRGHVAASMAKHALNEAAAEIASHGDSA
jgi:carbon-monoxide dehydrogenase medium subunit